MRVANRTQAAIWSMRHLPDPAAAEEIPPDLQGGDHLGSYSGREDQLVNARREVALNIAVPARAEDIVVALPGQ